MGSIQKPDITKEESGLQQNDGLRPSKEPSIAYDQNGKRLRPNDIGADRSEAEAKAMNDAITEATGNRRDQPSKDSLVKDPKDPSMTH